MTVMPGQAGPDNGGVVTAAKATDDGAATARQVFTSRLKGRPLVGSDGLLNAIADGTFGITRRPADGGRGLEGVFERAEGYFNPAAEFLEDPATAGEGRES